jgi:hypothetical protein
MTIELNIFRCESAASHTAPSPGHLLMKRCIGGPDASPDHFSKEMWSLYVDGTGALCWAVGNTVVKTPSNEVNMGPTADIPVSVWTHITVVVDSSGGNGVSASVSLFVNGNRSAKEHVTFAHRSEADLATTTLYMGCNLSGWRMTEVRVWADARQTVDIEGMRDNYLPLASKRKRMQFRIKGSKKLFGPPPASLAIGGVDPPAGSKKPTVHKAKVVDDDDDSPPAKGGLSRPKSGGLAAPGGLAGPKSGGLAAPGGLAGPKSGGLAAPGGLAGPKSGGLAAPGGLAGPKSGGLAAPGGGGLAPPGSADGAAARRNRRASVGGLPSSSAGEIRPLSVRGAPGSTEEQSEQQPPATAAEPHAEANQGAEGGEEESKQAPTAPFASPPKSGTGLLKAPGSGGLAPPAASRRGGRRSSVGNFDAATVSRQLAVRMDSADAAPSSTDVDTKTFIEKNIVAAGLTTNDVVRCIRRRPLSLGLPMVTPRSAQSFEDQDVVIVVDMPTSTNPELVVNKYNVSAESAIISPDSSERTIAFYKQKKLIVKNLHSDKTLVEMPMSLPHVFWMYDGPNTILLASAVAIYSWDVSPAHVSSSRPVKMADRVDIADTKRSVFLCNFNTLLLSVASASVF